jgi:uncharacterized protein YceK
MRAIVVCLALFSLAGCGSSDSGTGPGAGGGAAIAGSYTLKTVDNKALPVAFTDSSLVSGQLTVTDSGWAQTTIVKYALGGNPAGDTLMLSGAWETNGSNLTLYDNGNTTTYTGTYTSTSINLTTKTATLLSYSK